MYSHVHHHYIWFKLQEKRIAHGRPHRLPTHRKRITGHWKRVSYLGLATALDPRRLARYNVKFGSNEWDSLFVRCAGCDLTIHTELQMNASGRINHYDASVWARSHRGCTNASKVSKDGKGEISTGGAPRPRNASRSTFPRSTHLVSRGEHTLPRKSISKETSRHPAECRRHPRKVQETKAVQLQLREAQLLEQLRVPTTLIKRKEDDRAAEYFAG